ncbi:hypothetical protein Tco_0411711 [Tanacetum coccineum]
MEIYIGITLRSNTSCHITDCHAGNPCVHKLDQTAKIKAPMIGKMDGYDWQERVEQGRPRRTMSSPNHPTSEIEDAFSSNFPDFIPASPDYVPALPGKTYSSSSNSFGLVPIASPTLLLFHDDPYMKVLQAFYDKESPIPPPTIVPPSSMFNPQEVFLTEGLLSPRNITRSSPLFCPTQEFEMG